MARIRGLKPDFFKDEDLAALPFEARILFEGLWCWADKKGRLEDRPKYLKAEIFPYDKVDIKKLFDLLANPKIEGKPEKVFIRRYTVNGKKYVDIPEFLKHQAPHYTEKDSNFPAFNGGLTVKHRGLTVKHQEDTVLDRDTVQDTDRDIVEQVVSHLNTVLETDYKPQSKKTRDLITAKLNQGFTFENFKTVIDKKTRQWRGDPKMCAYLRPETIFGTKFESYLNERAGPEPLPYSDITAKNLEAAQRVIAKMERKNGE